tara:strand:- start:418 stop:711 length:294 start_codon:yes stop_codon:yes gene_type:complete
MEKAGPARLLIRAASVEAAEAAGTETQKTSVMANIKYRREIHDIHNAWCLKNGYPTKPYVPRPGRPKITSAQAQMRKRPSLRLRVQASSLKPQAPRS